MPTTMILPLYVLLPALFLGGVNGLRRGWKDELWTLGGLLVTLAIVSRPDMLLPVVERVISVFLRAGQELIGRDTSGPSFAFPDAVRPWIVLLAAALLAAGSYTVGRLLGKGEIGRGVWRIIGFLIGGVNVAGIAIWLGARFLERRADGSAGLTLPSFEGRRIDFSTPTANSVLASWPGLIGMLIVLIAVLVLLSRARVFR